jgi:hypothetical protein
MGRTPQRSRKDQLSYYLMKPLGMWWPKPTIFCWNIVTGWPTYRSERNAVVPPSSLITPPPSLDRQLGTRQLAVLPECNSISASASLAGASSASAQFSVSLSSVSSTCSVTSASLQAALVSAQGAFASAQLSAAAALRLVLMHTLIHHHNGDTSSWGKRLSQRTSN